MTSFLWPRCIILCTERRTCWINTVKISPKWKRDLFLNLVIFALTAFLLVRYVSLLTNENIGIAQGNSDFLDCYTAGKILAAGKGPLLYDIQTQMAYQREILDALHSTVHYEGGVLLYSHPPIAALGYLPLAHLPFWHAFLVWNCFSVLCLLLALIVLIRINGLLQIAPLRLLVLGTIGFIPLFITVAQGQNTFLALLILALAVALMKGSKELPAGILLSLMIIKFQLLPLFVIIIILKKRWKGLAGFIIGSTCVLMASLILVGPEGLLSYLRLLSQAPSFITQYGFAAAGGICIRGQVYGLLLHNHPQLAMMLSLALAAGLAGVALWRWRGPWHAESAQFDLKMAMTVPIALLISPLINFHDLSFLILPIFTIFGFAVREPLSTGMRNLLLTALLLVGYVLPPIQLAFKNIYGYQPMVLGMLALVTIVVLRFKSMCTNPNRLC
jgi:hypothetical protein